MSAPAWYDPRHNGQGHWKPTPKPSKVRTVLDIAVFTIALTGFLVLMAGLYVVARTGLCAVYDDGLRNCPGYVAEQSR
jgi:hypothetical protein